VNSTSADVVWNLADAASILLSTFSKSSAATALAAENPKVQSAAKNNNLFNCIRFLTLFDARSFAKVREISAMGSQKPFNRLQAAQG
jgi:hypothetical protein